MRLDGRVATALPISLTQHVARYNMYNYIPLPTNMRDFSAVVTMRIEEGSAGFGVYVMILSLLRDMPNYRVNDNYKQLAFTVNERDIELVQRVLHNYGLFEVDGDGQLFSPWLLQQMEAYDQRKKKLQEAGRRGAAKRFATEASENSQAIATPKPPLPQPAALNTTLPNMTEHDITKPTQAIAGDWREICVSQGKAVDADLLDALCKTMHEGHAPGYVAQVCIKYGMGENVLNFICGRSNNAEVTHPYYKRFCALVGRVEREKYPLKMPANFFLSKLEE